MYEELDVSVMLGETLVNAERVGNERLYFTTASGKKYLMHHKKRRGEVEYIRSIAGDIGNIVEEPLLIAEEVPSEDTPPEEFVQGDDCYIWTFYKFATRKGCVTVHWYGGSHGPDSKRVSFIQVE